MSCKEQFVCFRMLDHFEVWLEANYDCIKDKFGISFICQGSKKHCIKVWNKMNKKYKIKDPRINRW